jgi:hypothetical protein
MTITHATPATHILRYDTCLTDMRDVASEVFGHMVQLARPVMVAYHSDLYHDALWLDQNLSGAEYTFFWSFNDTGTIIGTPGNEIGRRKYAYLFRVAVVNGRATLTISDAPDSEQVDAVDPASAD